MKKEEEERNKREEKKRSTNVHTENENNKSTYA